jgi:hypothetical protein
MSGTALGVLVAVVLGLAAVVVVGWPLLREDDDRASEPSGDAPAALARRDLDEAIARSLDAIREIEADHRAGNLSDDDFRELDRAERARAADLIRIRDEGTPPSPPGG